MRMLHPTSEERKYDLSDWTFWFEWDRKFPGKLLTRNRIVQRANNIQQAAILQVERSWWGLRSEKNGLTWHEEYNHSRNHSLHTCWDEKYHAEPWNLRPQSSLVSCKKKVIIEKKGNCPFSLKGVWKGGSKQQMAGQWSLNGWYFTLQAVVLVFVRSLKSSVFTCTFDLFLISSFESLLIRILD